MNVCKHVCACLWLYYYVPGGSGLCMSKLSGQPWQTLGYWIITCLLAAECVSAAHVCVSESLCGCVQILFKVKSIKGFNKQCNTTSYMFWISYQKSKSNIVRGSSSRGVARNYGPCAVGESGLKMSTAIIPSFTNICCHIQPYCHIFTKIKQAFV